MARYGILLLSFSFILLGFKPASQDPVIIMKLLPPPSDILCLISRIIIILLLMIDAIWMVKQIVSAENLWHKAMLLLSIGILGLITVSLIPPIPVFDQNLYASIGALAILTSLVFIAAILCEPLSDGLEEFIKQHRPIYLLIVWFIYIIGFVKALQSIRPEQDFAFNLVFWIGYIWFLVIGIILVKSSWQREA